MATTLKISDITRDSRLQLRVSMVEEAIEDYAEAYKEGKPLPSVLVYQEGGTLWLVDGFHRVAAKERIGHEDIECDVLQGSFNDALLEALSANQAHGLRRTNADKRKAVLTTLQVEEWANWSNGRIAKQCGVSDRFVSDLREKHKVPPSPIRLGKDGRTIVTKNIKAKKPLSKSQVITTTSDPTPNDSESTQPHPLEANEAQASDLGSNHDSKSQVITTTSDPTPNDSESTKVEPTSWASEMKTLIDELPLPGEDPKESEQAIRSVIKHLLVRFTNAGFQLKK